MIRTEAEIRAEIDRYKNTYDQLSVDDTISEAFFRGGILVLKWALSGSPAPVEGDDEIAKQAALVLVDGMLGDTTPLTRARAVVKAIRPLIERAARAGAEAEIAAVESRGEQRGRIAELQWAGKAIRSLGLWDCVAAIAARVAALQAKEPAP